MFTLDCPSIYGLQKRTDTCKSFANEYKGQFNAKRIIYIEI